MRGTVTKTFTIAAANLKGGVGKTSWTVTIAEALARLKQRVLVIDMDGQANTSRTIAVDPSPADISMFDVLLNKDEATLRKAINQATRIPGVHHLPARLKMHNLGFAEQLRESVATPYKILRNRLRPIMGEYDFILIDTRPALDILTMNALGAADAYVIPFQSGDIYGLDGMDDLDDVINSKVLDPDVNPDLKFLGAVLQHHSANQSACKVTQQLIQDRYDIFGIVPLNAAVKQAAMNNQTVLEYDRKSSAAAAYVDMAKRIMALCGKKSTETRGRKRAEPAGA